METLLHDVLPERLAEQFHEAKERGSEDGMFRAISELEEMGEVSMAQDLQDEFDMMCKHCFDTGKVQVWKAADDMVELQCFHCRHDHDPEN